MFWLLVQIVGSALLVILAVVSSYVWMKIDAGIDRRSYNVGPCKSFVINRLSVHTRLLAKAVLKVYVWRYNL